VLKEGATAAPYISLEAAKAAGAVTLNYGFFINTIISFLIISVVIFFLVKAVNTLRKKDAAKVKDCPFCYTSIDLRATRCPNCTSELPE